MNPQELSALLATLPEDVIVDGIIFVGCEHRHYVGIRGKHADGKAFRMNREIVREEGRKIALLPADRVSRIAPDLPF